MKTYLIFDLDGTLISSDKQISNIIYDYVVNNIDPELLDTVKYLVENNQWMSLKETFNKLIKDSKESEKHYQIVTKLIDSIDDEVKFFPWVINKIKELSKNYTLFLSTWNSDNFANHVLNQWGIHDCFEKILWSSYILKSTQHIDELINYTWDENFSKQAIFIWDWQRDREIAKNKNIDFIHIWTDNTDTYEIQSVSKIDEVLNKIINKWKR